MIAEVAQQVQNLYNLFVKIDATQIEINPLAQTTDNKGLRKSFKIVILVKNKTSNFGLFC